VPAITVGLPAAMTAPRPAREVACEASTVDEALRAVVEQAPQLEQRIFYGDRLLVVVTLNGRHLPPATVRQTELTNGDRVEILLPVAGG
jgi:sulfur carrier protein ThiS